MSSKKCRQCRLVNFAAATNCNRCQASLGEFDSIAEQRTYQTSNREIPHYEQPPPPPRFDGGYNKRDQTTLPTANCSICGKHEDVSLRTFKRNFIPEFVYIFMCVGILIGLILMAIFKVKYAVQMPFCKECWKGHNFAKIIEPVSLIVFFGAICLGLYIAAWHYLVVPTIICGVVALVSVCFASWYKSKYTPKVKKINKKKMIIETKLNGELVFQQ